MTVQLDDLVCSAKRCRNTAVWALLWNNPKIHDAPRRKTWLACDDHLDHLSTFLGARSFLKETVPVSDLPRSGGGGEAPRTAT
ncbi:hypothetical protein Bcav_2324 [Beutenbergia cavernae DSM 12333]|uniref:Acetone carboxylase n=1 Tax=Beutenbergia cavernae (strain ATCC BAA-8 / DSM 12333 / CCUG 43141 / JCM 11478 / NBRC 16432 / NCIMB 13614 / HKI 0122) TaxID=471853 RepID=C5BVX4_BEUC1|nr:hypothetical protein [Beutenbergia cavernae]ACQ80575.1 hypothetical protein Bcav_2324 [Beutenbergia cavernae DSM 12333]